MPRQTILLKLGPAPKGYTWELSRIQGHRGGMFGEQGFTYTISLKQGNSVIVDQRFFISKADQNLTASIIKKNEEAIKKIVS